MLQLIPSAARTVAAASLFGAALLSSPVQAASSGQPAQAAPIQLAADQAATPAKPKRSPTERVDSHIKNLHDRLKISAAQEQSWGAVAQVMRDNAAQMQLAIQQRQEAAKTLTAIDDLKAYQAIAEAHVQGLQKLIPAFQALYSTMPADQQKNADAVFSQSLKPPRRVSK
jgi:periplasmic protein CpxP/Spy